MAGTQVWTAGNDARHARFPDEGKPLIDCGCSLFRMAYVLAPSERPRPRTTPYNTFATGGVPQEHSAIQRCRHHKAINALNTVAKSVQPAMKQNPRGIRMAPDRGQFPGWLRRAIACRSSAPPMRGPAPNTLSDTEFVADEVAAINMADCVKHYCNFRGGVVDPVAHEKR